ncbi:MAG: hypothetical protein JWN23_2115 [Rhodocyclales bacterium]|nr:hypothetical protein [Rhodocyclales bacterium]
MKKLLLALVALLLSAQCFAQVVTTKGVGSASYNWVLSQSDKDKALKAAQVSAVERYFAENGEAESENFEAIQPMVEANLEKFILSTTIINEQNIENLKKYSVSVRVDLNVAKLRSTIRGASATAKAAIGERSQLVYVFVGREAASVRSYDDRIVKRTEIEGDASMDQSKSVKGTEGEAVRSNKVSTTANKRTSESVNVKASAKVETGGSTTKKADDLSYRLLPMNNTKTSITSVFSQGGFQVADPEFVLDDKDIKAVNQDFSTGNDLAPSTIRAVVASLRKAQIPLLVLATLDVGIPSQDNATGMQRVAVTVTGRVLDISGNLPREVASVPAVQYFGIGPDNASASGKALKDASQAAAREVVSRLNAAGVH